jgi:protein TonB
MIVLKVSEDEEEGGVARPWQGRSLLVSLGAHLGIVALVALTLRTAASIAPPPTTLVSPAQPQRKVFLAPRPLPAVPVVPRTPPRTIRERIPTEVPTPPPAPKPPSDRISLGAARPGGGPSAPAPPGPVPSAAPPAATAGSEALRLPQGGTRPAPRDGEGPARSLGDSLRNLDRHLGGGGGARGLGRQIGSLFFDPQGADFTEWVSHFRREVYRNWLIPQAVMLGFRGHVDIEFWVERDGRVTDLKVMKSSGTSSLDRAAANALLASRLQALPADFAPARLYIQASFFYNEEPQG